MQPQRLLGALLSLTALGAFAYALSARPTPAHAEGADLMDGPRQRYADFRTLTISTDRGVLRIDTDRRAMALDLIGAPRKSQGWGDVPIPSIEARITWADDRLWIARTLGEPVELPALFADRVGEVYDTITQGLDDFTFEVQHPGQLNADYVETYKLHFRSGPDLQLDRWRRVHTPWAWDDDFAVFVFVGHQRGEIAGLNILDLRSSAKRPLTLAGPEEPRTDDFGFVGIADELYDLPINPDIEDPHKPKDLREHWPQYAGNPDKMLYHEKLRTVFLEQNASSTDPPRLDDSCEAAGTTTMPVTAMWTVPSDPDTQARLNAARAQCSEVRLATGMRVKLKAPSVGEACYQGQWRVIDRSTTPPRVLWSENVGTCVADGDLVDPFDKVAKIPAQASAGDLAMQFVGTATMTCAAIGDPNQSGLIRFEYVSEKNNLHGRFRFHPRLTWDCYPGW
jgi:hypothetical protein